MKDKTLSCQVTSARPWRGNPSIRVSPSVHRLLEADSLRIALHHHRDLDNLPYAFRGAGGKKIMIATTADNYYTFLFPADEWDLYDKKYLLRKIDEMTVMEV